MKILIADDEKEIRKILRLLLEGKGHSVVEASNGEIAVETVMNNADIDLCIMDIMMPELSGVDAVEKIRKFSAVPVLFLTAKSMDSDKEMAYRSGGDDYLVKPFGRAELLMKVEALTRRYNQYSGKSDSSQDTVKLGFGVMINPETREVFKFGEPVDIRDKEMEVLLYLAANRGRAISSGELYESVWGEMPLPSSSNTVTVHILNVRRKLEDAPSSPKLIRTVWGKGYQID
jgi:DNA-binding response OmpR family regulator